MAPDGDKIQDSRVLQLGTQAVVVGGGNDQVSALFAVSAVQRRQGVSDCHEASSLVPCCKTTLWLGSGRCVRNVGVECAGDGELDGACRPIC